MNTEISRYLVDENGNSFSSDSDLQALSNDSKVKNTNSGVSYKKVSGTSVPVFEKEPFPLDTVLYDTAQQLTEAQKQRARTNIGALATSDLLVGSKTQKGILQVGSGINVSSGVISVDDDYIIGLVGGITPEVKEAIYSEVSVFGTNTTPQKSVVGQLYAGSKLYTTTSETGGRLELSDSLSGTWKCIVSSSVRCIRQDDGTSGTTYSFEVRCGSFIKV